MNEQLILIDGVRVDLPKCYQEIVEAIQNAHHNGHDDIDEMEPLHLAYEMIDYAGFEYSREQMELAIKIYRERKANGWYPDGEK